MPLLSPFTSLDSSMPMLCASMHFARHYLNSFTTIIVPVSAHSFLVLDFLSQYPTSMLSASFYTWT
jgi:hypothetical protein